MENAVNLVTGANKDEYHYVGFNPRRDVKDISFASYVTTKET